MQIEDGLFLVNGNRKLYFQEGEWFKPLFHMKRFTGNIQKLEKQPKIIKSVEKIRYLS